MTPEIPATPADLATVLLATIGSLAGIEPTFEHPHSRAAAMAMIARAQDDRR